jgi:pantoate kinase
VSPSAVRRARAFAPGHVTGLFEPVVSARDPRARGSRGAGVVLEQGVHAEASWSPSARAGVSVTGERGLALPISTEVARRLKPAGSGRLSVQLRHELPVGQGFGMSAAGALATALAVGSLAGRPRADAIEVAHLADLFGGGGLGGVAAILGGGLEIRSRPGIPPFGAVTWTEFDLPIWVGVLGRPIPSPSILRDPRRMRQIARAARELDGVIDAPTMDAMLSASERFTDRLPFASREVRASLRALRRCGARAAQAMFGNAFFAVAPNPAVRSEVIGWLEKAEVRAVEIRASGRGAGLRVSSRGGSAVARR